MAPQAILRITETAHTRLGYALIVVDFNGPMLPPMRKTHDVSPSYLLHVQVRHSTLSC